MTGDEIIAKVNEQNFPEGSYIIFGSCPMAILGIRESNDIDMLVSEELHKELKEKGWKKIIKSPKDHPLTFDVFEAHDHWNFSSYNPTLEELLSRAIEVKGVMFASIEDVKKWKASSGRDKDFIDIDLIDSYLKGKVG